jgi:transcriptional regulator with XRE-family HTH domain
MLNAREFPLRTPMVDGHQVHPQLSRESLRLGVRLSHPRGEFHSVDLPNEQFACQASFASQVLESASGEAENGSMPAKQASPRPAASTLKQWRLYRGLTQEQVANRMGVGPQAVHKWEAGKTPVDIEKLRLLAEIYETTPDALLYDPVEGELVERMRRAYHVLKRLPATSADKWLGVGEDMAPPTEQK